MRVGALKAKQVLFDLLADWCPEQCWRLDSGQFEAASYSGRGWTRALWGSESSTSVYIYFSC